MLLDIFNDDAFSVVELTEAINHAPRVPSKLSSLFTVKGVRTTSIAVEQKDGVLQLIPTTPRGTDGVANRRRSRDVRNMDTVRIAVSDTIMAADIQNVRSFEEGSQENYDAQLEAAAELLDEVNADMRSSIEATQEFHRAGAINGEVLDADGSTVLYNIFDLFGLTETLVSITFGTTDMKQTSKDLYRTMETILGTVPFTGLRAYCTPSFFDGLIATTEVKDAYDRWMDGLFHRNLQGNTDGHQFDAFIYGGIEWVEYNYSVGGVDFLTDGDARLIPLGVDNLMEYYAPADYMEAANTKGKPFYAKQEPLKFNRGIESEVQSNPLMVAKRPKSLIRLSS